MMFLMYRIYRYFGMTKVFLYWMIQQSQTSYITNCVNTSWHVVSVTDIFHGICGMVIQVCVSRLRGAVNIVDMVNPHIWLGFHIKGDVGGLAVTSIDVRPVILMSILRSFLSPPSVWFGGARLNDGVVGIQTVWQSQPDFWNQHFMLIKTLWVRVYTKV